MILSIAWKNIWRNRNRSLTVIIAVALGIISGIMVIGIMEGWVRQRLHDAIFNEVSHNQIHNADYQKNEEIQLTVENGDKIISQINNMPEIAGWVTRTKVVAMANTAWASTGIFIYGIDPERERKVTEISKRIVPGGGNYIDKNIPGSVLISDKTAEILKLKQYCISEEVVKELVADKIPATILDKLKDAYNIRFRSPKEFRDALKERLSKKQLDRYGKTIMDNSLDYRVKSKIQVTLSDMKGNPVQGTFRVCGIYKTTNTGFDQQTVFVNSGDLKDLVAADATPVHEVALLLNDEKKCDEIKQRLETIAGKNKVSTWKELAPDAAMMNDFMVMYYIIFIGIIMLALAFGIINTMMMAILERTKELGMLIAIGMNKRRIFSMIMLETVFLTMVGAIAGMVSGWLIITLTGKTGIYFASWGEGFEAVGFAARVYPVITPLFFILIIVMVIFTAILSSVWPARKALKLIPVEAIRTE
jgi:putative ABC transport system permease protein